MYGAGYIFSKTFFRGWVIVSVLWAVGLIFILVCAAILICRFCIQFFAIFAVTVFPIVEGRHTLLSIAKSFFQKDKRPTGHSEHSGYSADSESQQQQAGPLEDKEKEGGGSPADNEFKSKDI